jgi:membrane-associated phospholipid phosphatase
VSDRLDVRRPAVSGIPDGSGSALHVEPRGPGQLGRLTPLLHRVPPLVASWIVAGVGAFVLAALMVGLGFFVTKVVLASALISRADERLPEWLAGHRSSVWTQWSYVGSMLGDAPVVVPLVSVVALALVARRRLRAASFVVHAGLLELVAYSLTVLVVERPRPDVPRLDDLVSNHSFPSGHVALATAVYGALAVLLGAHVRARPARIVIWSVAVLLPCVVALSRIYRGEHHPIDVAAGALMGAGILLVALGAARTARAGDELRAAEPNRGHEPSTGAGRP